MITPNEDKEVIKSILNTDKFISRAGFNNDNIKTTKASSDVINLNKPDLQIFISMGTPESGSSYEVKNMVYNVSVSGSRALQKRIDSVVAQIIALLNEVNIGRGHILYLLDPPLELASDPMVYVVETTFLCQSTVYNVVQK